MSGTAYTAQGISRRAFENLVLFWLAAFALTVLVAVLFFAPKPAQAMEPLPLPKMLRNVESAEITKFSSFSSLASKSDRCQSLLKSASRTNGQDALAGRNRRTAGSSDVQMVAAVRAYRQCRSEQALAQLTDWRWLR
jgi:hypothetical protein